MNVIRKLSLFAYAALACAGCGTVGVTLGDRTWNGACYRTLREDVEHLAGVSALDCGLLRLDAAEGSQQQITACAKTAMASGRAFRFGYESAGDDSRFCDVAVRSADGGMWRLYFDSDVTGQWGRGDDHSALSLARCESLEFRPGTIGRGSFFALNGCLPAPEIAKSIVAQRSARR